MSSSTSSKLRISKSFESITAWEIKICINISSAVSKKELPGNFGVFNESIASEDAIRSLAIANDDNLTLGGEEVMLVLFMFKIEGNPNEVGELVVWTLALNHVSLNCMLCTVRY